MAKVKMICPKCGVEMNHHAVKLIYTTDDGHAAKIDQSLGGIVEETYNCPSCGAVGSRFAE